MPPFARKARRHPLLLPYCVFLAGHRGGEVARGYNEGHLVADLMGSPYRHHISAVASWERIFPLFTALRGFVESPFMAVLEKHLDSRTEVYESTTCTVDEASKVFEEHSFQLVNDGFTGFGLTSEAFEIFVGQHKDVSIYCNSLEQVMDVMEELEIPHNDELAWISQIPHYHFEIGALFNDFELRKMCRTPPAMEVRRYKSDPGAYIGFLPDIADRLKMRIRTDRARH